MEQATTTRFTQAPRPAPALRRPASIRAPRPASQQRQDLSPQTVGLGEVERQVAQVVAVVVPAGARISQQAQLQQAPPHAGLGLRPAAVADRALSAAAVARIRAACSASAAWPAPVSR